jgi:hypothetical protein
MLPWITLTSNFMSASVVGSAGDGWIIAACALLSLIVLYNPRSWKFSAIAAAAATGLSVFEIVHFADMVTSYQNDGIAVTFGPGLGLTFFGSLVAGGIIVSSHETKSAVEFPNSDKLA